MESRQRVNLEDENFDFIAKVITGECRQGIFNASESCFLLDNLKSITMFSIIPTLFPKNPSAAGWKASLQLVLLILVFHFATGNGRAEDAVAYTKPHGFVKVAVHPGTGLAKRTTLFSIPLLGEPSIEGRDAGVVSQVGSNSITSSNAGWVVGEMSNRNAPYLMEMTSGELEGRIFILSTSVANTSDAVFIDDSEFETGQSLSSLGVSAGDRYKIWPADTLGSLFGEAREGGVQGGITPQTADTIVLVSSGSASTYFFNTGATPPRWTKVALGSPDATHTVIPPYTAVQYARIANTALDLVMVGAVPEGRRVVRIKDSGPTLLSAYWAAPQTLDQLALETTPGWRAGSNAAVADTVVLVSRGGAATYFHDGVHWRRVSFGAPLAGSAQIPIGGGIMVSRRGAGAGGSHYQSYSPYSFGQ